MKVIFLDIDGPLAYGDNEDAVIISDDIHIEYQWQQEACDALSEIIKQTDAKIVISSDWRKFYSVDEFNEIFKYYKIPPVVIDITDRHKAKLSSSLVMDRAYQIVRWLSNHSDDLTKLKSGEVYSWIAIDDMFLADWFKDFDYAKNTVTEKNCILITGEFDETPNLKLENNVKKIIDFLNGRTEG